MIVYYVFNLMMKTKVQTMMMTFLVLRMLFRKISQKYPGEMDSNPELAHTLELASCWIGFSYLLIVLNLVAIIREYAIDYNE